MNSPCLPWRIALLGAAACVLSVAPAFGEPVGTGFQFQATIADSAGPVDGPVDLRLTLYDAADHGAVVAGPLLVDDIVVSDGRCLLELDFGAVFDGSARWLAIELRDGGSSGDYTVLGPRQKVRATPYAAHAVVADTAAVAGTVPMAGDADTLDAQHGAFYREWGNLTGVPAGLDDGDDDTLAGLACVAGQLPVWGAGGWECGWEPGAGYASITVVGPVGDPIANGAALLAAMDTIPEPTSAEQARLLLIEPGLYDLDGSVLLGKDWVDIAGAGRNLTVVTSSRCAPTSGYVVGTVVTASHAELRDLAVVNTCSDAGQVGFAINSSSNNESSRITRVDAVASVGPTVLRAFGVLNRANGGVTEDVTATASGATELNFAIYAKGDHSMVIDCIGVASGGSFARGLEVFGSGSDIEYHTSVRRGSFKALGTGEAIGVAVYEGSADLESVEAVGEPAVVIGTNRPFTVRVSQLVTTGSVDIWGFLGVLDVEISNSRIVAAGPAITASSELDVRVAATQLWGGPVSGGVSCAGVWDENWIFYTGTCP